MRLVFPRGGVNLPRLVIPALVICLPVEAVVSIGVGQLGASPGEVLTCLLAGPHATDVPRELSTVIWQLRLPRTVVGALAGAVLAVTGACLQAVTRNGLADPYLLGVSSGSSFGAALVIAGGLGASTAGALSAAGGAFLGALAALGLVLVLVGGGARLSSTRLVLAGLTAGYFLSAGTNLVVVLSDNRDAVRAITFWMLGSLTRSSWDHVPVLAGASALLLIDLAARSRSLDALALGDDVARSLGTDPMALRRRVAAVAAVAVAAAVAVSGSIGFIGLVVPHLARRLVGAPHRLLLPTSALLGAVVIIAADCLARTALAPREIPLGILTALTGTPMLMWLLRSRRAGEA